MRILLAVCLFFDLGNHDEASVLLRTVCEPLHRRSKRHPSLTGISFDRFEQSPACEVTGSSRDAFRTTGEFFRSTRCEFSLSSSGMTVSRLSESSSSVEASVTRPGMSSIAKDISHVQSFKKDRPSLQATDEPQAVSRQATWPPSSCLKSLSMSDVSPKAPMNRV